MVARELLRLAKVAGASAGVSIIVVNQLGLVAKVEGNSMQPTFNPTCGQRNIDLRILQENKPNREEVKRELKTRLQQDRVFLNKWVVHDKRNLKIGDVVILTSPRNPTKSLIKRIVAMPGDAIHIIETGETLVIEEGHCWVEGDNQQSSYDSGNFGQVPLGLIEGKVCAIVWPLNRVRLIHCDPSISLNSSKTILISQNQSTI